MSRTAPLVLAAVTAAACGLAAAAPVAPAQQLPADVIHPSAGDLPAAPAPLFIHSRRVRARGGVARVVVECPPLAGRCRGTLELTSLLPEGALGRAPVDIGPGERRAVRLRVKRRARIVPGRVTFRAGEALSARLVVVAGA